MSLASCLLSKFIRNLDYLKETIVRLFFVFLLILMKYVDSEDTQESGDVSGKLVTFTRMVSLKGGKKVF